MIDKPYFDGPDSEMGEDHEPTEGSETEQNEGQMAVVNREVCPDCNPGDTLTFKVVRVHNDEIELQYEGMGGEEAGKEESPAPEEPAMAEGGGDY